MAKAWRNKSATIKLEGFEELIEKLQEAGANVESGALWCFDEATQNMYDALYEKGKSAGLEERLLDQIEEETVCKSMRYEYTVGWKKERPKTPLPDFYKVVFYNYGTPSGRFVKEGGQHVQIDGKWVTLGKNRGEESAHPKGSHGFIKKAKLAAANKNKKVFKKYLDDVLGGLQK